MHNKRLTKDEFEVIKKLLNQYSIKEIRTLTGRSKTTLHLIKRFKTFEEYQEYTKAKKAKSLNRKNTETVDDTTKVNPEVVKFAELELLMRIADSLDRLVILAEKKKRIF